MLTLALKELPLNIALAVASLPWCLLERAHCPIWQCKVHDGLIVEEVVSIKASSLFL